MHRKKEYSVCIISRIYPLPKAILIDSKRLVFTTHNLVFYLITFHIQPSRYSQNFLIYQISLHHKKSKVSFLDILLFFIFQLFIFNMILLHVYSNYFLCFFNLLFTYHTIKSLLHASSLQVFLSTIFVLFKAYVFLY